MLLAPGYVHVKLEPSHVLNEFVPAQVFGAGVDGREKGNAERVFRPHNVAAMRSAGLGPLTYRLRTELGCEAWHWNPEGTWSDPELRQGYWLSSATPGKKITVSWGYRLPRRGNTFDQANNDGYSRIDDGDLSTYWKSNPYLDHAYTGDADDRNPQWVVIDLRKAQPIDAIRVRWANPYAVRYRLEYWEGSNTAEPDDHPPGKWRVFPRGEVQSALGGDDLRSLGPSRKVRYVRLILLASSHTAEPSPHPDPRDTMGFAIREIGLGTLGQDGLRDVVRHRRKNDQTPFYTSSTDPWHRAADLDPGTEQPGFDLVHDSGLTNGQPMLVPVQVLYGTPEDSEAEIRWLKARGYPLRGVEMGEEPDGQYALPEHYGALYAQVAKRLKTVDPMLPLGGPCYQTTVVDVSAWPGSYYDVSWFRRFQSDLRRRGCLKDFEFFSFEWYPFDHPSLPAQPQLLEAPKLLEETVARFRRDGLSPKIPWMITEYGYSAFAGPSEVEPQAAVLNLDIVGKFLELGGDAAYLYGYEPNELIQEASGGWGNLTTWLVDSNGNARFPLPTYWAARMMTHDWCTQAPSIHRLVRTSSSDPSVSAYTVRRPNGTLAVLLLNKDAHRPKRVSLEFDGRKVPQGTTVEFGTREYAWRAAGQNGRPIKSLAPRRSAFQGVVFIPPFTATVAVFRIPTSKNTPTP